MFDRYRCIREKQLRSLVVECLMCLCVNSIGMELLEDVVEAVDLEAVDLAVDVEDGMPDVVELPDVVAGRLT